MPVIKMTGFKVAPDNKPVKNRYNILMLNLFTQKKSQKTLHFNESLPRH